MELKTEMESPGIQEIPTKNKYIAFISYKHDAISIKEAKRLQRFLETYRIPPQISSRRKLGMVFRDVDELSAGHDLSKKLKQALDDSAFLIVICSYQTRSSTWVDQEIQYFLKNHDPDHVICVVTEGSPAMVLPDLLNPAGNKTGNSQFNQNSEGNIPEPLAACLCDGKGPVSFRQRYQEYLRIAAAILGCSYDALFQRTRRRARKNAMLAGTGALAVCGVFGGVLLVKQHELQLQKMEALILQAQTKATQAVVLAEQGKMDQALEQASSSLLLKETPAGQRALHQALADMQPNEFHKKQVIQTEEENYNLAVNDQGDIFSLAHDRNDVCVIGMDSTGARRWKTTLEAHEHGIFYGLNMRDFVWSPMENTILITGEKHAFILDAETGEVLWRNTSTLFPLKTEVETGQIVLYDLEQDELLFVQARTLENDFTAQKPKVFEWRIELPEPIQSFQPVNDRYLNYGNYLAAWSPDFSRFVFAPFIQNMNEETRKQGVEEPGLEEMDFEVEEIHEENDVADSAADGKEKNNVNGDNNDEYEYEEDDSAEKLLTVQPWILDFSSWSWQEAEGQSFDQIVYGCAGMDEQNRIWMLLSHDELENLTSEAFFYDADGHLEATSSQTRFMESGWITSESPDIFRIQNRHQAVVSYGPMVHVLNLESRKMDQILQHGSNVKGMSLYRVDENEELDSILIIDEDGKAQLYRPRSSYSGINKLYSGGIDLSAHISQAAPGSMLNPWMMVSLNAYKSNEILCIANPKPCLTLPDYYQTFGTSSLFKPMNDAHRVLLTNTDGSHLYAQLIDSQTKEIIRTLDISFDEYDVKAFEVDMKPIYLNEQASELVFTKPLALYNWENENLHMITKEEVQTVIDSQNGEWIAAWLDHETNCIQLLRQPENDGSYMDQLKPTAIPLPADTAAADVLYLDLDYSGQILLNCAGSAFGANQCFLLFSNDSSSFSWLPVDEAAVETAGGSLKLVSASGSEMLCKERYELDGRLFLFEKDRKSGKMQIQHVYPDCSTGYLARDCSWVVLADPQYGFQAYDTKTGTCLWMQLEENLSITSAPRFWEDRETGWLIAATDITGTAGNAYIADPGYWETIQEIRQMMDWNPATRTVWIQCSSPYAFPCEPHQLASLNELKEQAASALDEKRKDDSG